MTAKWAEIVEVIVPSSATSDETVNISIKVKNILTYAFSIGVTVVVDGGYATLTPFQTQPGATTIFSASFVMPEHSVTITITSWFVVSEWEWYSDDIVIKEVALEEEPEPVAVFSNFLVKSFTKV